MPDESIFKDVIGRASDLVPDLEPAEPVQAAPVHPLVSLEELERPSRQKGHPDPEFSDIDTRDPLYIPRFLIRRWGAERFKVSHYYALWQSEAGRARSSGDFVKKKMA